MKPEVVAAPDGEQQPEDEPEQPPPRRRPDTDQQSPLPPQKQHRRPRADREPDGEGDHRPAEEEEQNARPLTRPDLPFSRPWALAGRDL